MAKVTTKLREAGPHLALLLALAVMAVPAASPYFGDGVPRANDIFPHLFRVLALDRMVQAGVLWPRWSPDLVHGFGYPVFNFFPSLSHPVVELFHWPGLPLTTAYRTAVLAHFILTAWSAYFLGRALFGPMAGLVTALAYTYSPYLLYDAHVRGGLPESQALALLPLLLLALWYAAQGKIVWIIAVALAFTGMFLSHFPVTFQVALLCGVWLLFLAQRWGWRALTGPILGLGLGGLLTAFFWLPALTEIVHTRAAFSISQGYGYQQNFMSLGQLFAFPHLPADPALINPPVVRALPVIVLLWAAARLIWRWPGLGRDLRWQTAAWGLLLLLSTWLITPWSQPVWDNFSLLNQTLYPWRFLGMASLAATLLLGAAVAADARAGWRAGWLTAGLTLLIIAAAVPWLYPPREPIPEAPTLADLAAFEQPPLFIGTTTLGEFLPRWVEELPETTTMRDALVREGNPDRLLPHEAVHVRERSGPAWNAVYRLEATAPATLVYGQFYFPGWQAAVNGRPWPIQPGSPHGLIEFELPAGEHTVAVAFKNTPPRILGWIISGLGLLGGAALFLFQARLAPWLPGRLPEEASGEPGPNRPSAASLLALTALTLTAWAFFSLVETPLRRQTLLADGVWGRPSIEPLDFVGELRLLTFEPQTAAISADEPILLNLYWQAQRPIGVVYDVGVHILDENGLSWNGLDVDRPFDWRFVSGNDPWPLDSYRLDPFRLRLLDGAPPGNYHFHVGLVRRDTGQTVASHSLGQLTVNSPARGARPLEPGLTPAADEAIDQGLQLLGTRLDRWEANPGDPLQLTLLWQVIDPARLPANEMTLTLWTADGERLLTETAVIAPASFPPSQWGAGDRIRSEVTLRLPAGLPGGEHQWRVNLSGGAARPVGDLRLNEIARTWRTPALDAAVGVNLGGAATLVGAQIDAPTFTPGGLGELTLVWRSEAETAVSYRVFLHLLGDDGRLVAQSDGEPANWTRPTTGWLPGEYILDARLLPLPPDLPPGVYTLTAGLYNPNDGARLTSEDGRDYLIVAPLTLP